MDYKALTGGFLMGSLATYIALKVFKDSQAKAPTKKKEKSIPIVDPDHFKNDR